MADLSMGILGVMPFNLSGLGNAGLKAVPASPKDTPGRKARTAILKPFLTQQS